MKFLTEIGRRLHVRAQARSQKGATIIEYVLLAALIGIALIASFDALVVGIGGAFTNIVTTLTNATT